MPKKGTINNPKGRPVGSRNKMTKDLMGLVRSFLDKNIEDIQEQYDSLPPKEKLVFFERLLKFAIPTQSAANINFEKLSDDDLDNIINQLK